MDMLEKYKVIRKRLEYTAGMISIIIWWGISSYLGIYSKKLISLDTALCLAILAVFSLVLGNIAIKIADNWYHKNMLKP
ncbi:hypothetical protein E4V42_07090 [Clostridium estertheticum]|uniref:Uncharacterized protein n=1 Tax=Clostridium estertheticum TaxID=238834 RepID=A0A5N7IZF3_9CLOT|nr:hypothetical protein [Clostridium estertheticum]MPQ31202.1 hypothetical protein [Clostridium estertheticum]MPQ61877.1 hypothetical protein [Clostridium estertheticum]